MSTHGERRRALRGQVAGNALVTSADGRRDVLVIRNVSVSGALLEGAAPGPVGTTVLLLVHLRKTLPFEVEGEIVRREESSSKDSCFAITFRNLHRKSRAVLLEAILRQKAETGSSTAG
jgi:hypothetical protein